MSSRDIPISPVAKIWTREGLHELIATHMSDVKFVAVSNREPYRHVREKDGSIRVLQPASGLATALDPVMRASGGIWVAHGSSNADRETADEHGRVRVPPGDPAYTLHRVWLSKKLENEYYYGLANEGLWPLCHIVFHRPRFSQQNWDSYRQANQIFADAVLEEVGDKPGFVFIQDYHLALLPRMLKNANPNLNVAQFWHIPWPNRETFRAFPWKEELLDGMLGNDLLGFHLRYHCANFLDTVERHIESKVDREHAEVTRGGRVTMVRAFPISIDFSWIDKKASSREVEDEMCVWRQTIGNMPEFLGIGIDRIDYTKGIPERLQAFDVFLDNHPEYRGRVGFAQIGVPSRTQIKDYKELNEQIVKEAAAINRKWGTGDYQPVHLFVGEYSQLELMGLHRLANFCLVTPLHDGMNLVAKEFVASRFDEGGVLILSDFAGAAVELNDALLVNPFAIDQMADAIYRAVTMGPLEIQKRMQRLRARTSENNVYRWAGKILLTLLRLDTSDLTESESLDNATGPWNMAHSGASL